MLRAAGVKSIKQSLKRKLRSFSSIFDRNFWKMFTTQLLFACFTLAEIFSSFHFEGFSMGTFVHTHFSSVCVSERIGRSSVSRCFARHFDEM